MIKNEVMEMQVYFLGRAHDEIELRLKIVEAKERAVHKLWYSWIAVTLASVIAPMIYTLFTL